MSADDSRKDAPQHGRTKHQESALHAQKGYETLDAQAGATYRAGAYILGLMFLVALFVAPLYWFLARRETKAQEPAASVIREQPQDAAAQNFPKLVTSEPTVLAEFRKQEDELLNGWGWVEKDRGVARMPIAEAVRIVGERGALPEFPAASNANDVGAQPGPPAAGPGASAGSASATSPGTAPGAGAGGRAQPATGSGASGTAQPGTGSSAGASGAGGPSTTRPGRAQPARPRAPGGGAR